MSESSNGSSSGGDDGGGSAGQGGDEVVDSSTNEQGLPRVRNDRLLSAISQLRYCMCDLQHTVYLENLEVIIFGNSSTKRAVKQSVDEI